MTESLKNRFGAWSAGLSPKQKQVGLMVAVGGGMVTIALALSLLFDSSEKPQRARLPVAQKPDSSVILAGRNTEGLQMESMQNQLKMVQQELDAIKSGKTVPGQDRRIPGTPGVKASEVADAAGVPEPPRRGEVFENAPDFQPPSGMPPPPSRSGAMPFGDMPLDLPGIAPPPRRTVSGTDPMAAVDPKFRERNNLPDRAPGAPPEAVTQDNAPVSAPTSVKEPEIKIFRQEKRADAGDKRVDTGTGDRQTSAPRQGGGSQGGREQAVHLPAGSIISGTLLTGLDAPTAAETKRDPFPALLRVKHVALLPSLYTMDIRECFLIADGFGDLASSRVYLRASALSCIRSDGAVIETGVSAFSSGPDGKAGIPGRLVSRTGSLLARSMLAGFFGGIGQAAAPQRVQPLQVNPGSNTEFQTPDVSQLFGQGALSGASSAINKIADYYLQLADAAHPVVELNAGQPVDFIITKGAKLSIQYKPGQRERGTRGRT